MGPVLTASRGITTVPIFAACSWDFAQIGDQLWMRSIVMNASCMWLWNHPRNWWMVCCIRLIPSYPFTSHLCFRVPESLGWRVCKLIFLYEFYDFVFYNFDLISILIIYIYIYACSFLISFFMGSNCGFEFQYGCGYDWKISYEYLWYFLIVLDMVLHYVVFLSWPVLEMCL